MTVHQMNRDGFTLLAMGFTGKGQIYFVNLFLKGRAPAGTHQRKEVEKS